MTLPTIKVGQWWLCLDQHYRAKIVAIDGRRARASLYWTLDPRSCARQGEYRYQLTCSQESVPRDGGLYHVVTLYLAEGQNAPWPANLASLIYDPPDA